MTPDTVMDLMRQTMYVVTLIVAPLLLSALAIGLIIGMFQAATQINEMTLTFIPKLLIMILALALAGPWMLELLMDFTIELYHHIPETLG